MNPDEYVSAAIRTESVNHRKITERLQNTQLQRLLHAAIGLCTEAGEFQDALKKHIYYGEELDLINLIEEMGDVLWYVAISCDALGENMGDVMRLNVEKLRQRYPNGFAQEKALERDTKAEVEHIKQSLTAASETTDSLIAGFLVENPDATIHDISKGLKQRNPNRRGLSIVSIARSRIWKQHAALKRKRSRNKGEDKQ